MNSFALINKKNENQNRLNCSKLGYRDFLLKQLPSVRDIYGESKFGPRHKLSSTYPFPLLNGSKMSPK